MAEVMYCNRCGAQNSALAKFCANCGTPFGSEAVTSAGPEVTPAARGPADVSAQTGLQPMPYAPAPYSTSAATAGSGQYGGFWVRVVAAIIDALALGIVVWPFSFMVGLVIMVAGRKTDMPWVGIHFVRGIVAGALFLFAGWIYEAGMESSSKQATLGKMALGLKVTDEYGKRIGFARASARFFSKILSRMILMIGYIMVGFTARKQGLHDMIAGTLVMRAR